jgi:GNAT superfamily N-acetyltransferase
MIIETANAKCDSNSGRLRYAEYRIRLERGKIAKIQVVFLPEKRAEIAWLTVPVSHRKAGIGRYLVNFVCEMADQEGLRLLLWPVDCGRIGLDTLLRFYRSFGFRLVAPNVAGFKSMVRRPRARRRPRAA